MKLTISYSDLIFIYYNDRNINFNNWYTIDSETSINLYQGETNIGMLTDIILTENFISFNIELTGANEQIEADKDPTYGEATDPNAPTNTGSSTIASKPCTMKRN